VTNSQLGKSDAAKKQANVVGNFVAGLFRPSRVVRAQQRSTLDLNGSLLLDLSVK
jgi:hypothetical protein